MLRIRSITLVLRRGARQRCPQCGVGRLFHGFYHSYSHCTHCNLEFEPEDGGTWAFMYVSTAFITGVFFLGMFFIRPTNTALWRWIVLAVDVPAILCSLPYRKGVAIALEYLVDLGMQSDRDVELRTNEQHREPQEARID